MTVGVPHHGGATWAVLQWVLGLRRLGHDVLLVEPVDEPSVDQLAYFGSITHGFGLAGAAALLTSGRGAVGMTFDDVVGFVDGADLLVNLAGTLRDPELVERPPVRAYVDLDPAFTQLWQEVDGIDMGFGHHTHLLTVGLNVGRPGCRVPTCGRRWIPAPPPVVLEQWPAAEPLRAPWTTVASWRGYGPVVHDGVHHGQKAHSWRSLLALPGQVPVEVLPALGIDGGEQKDIAALHEHGWRWVDPLMVTGTAHDYRSFVRASGGELGVAKSGYVVSRCGWFSDRSACYLASGRPVAAQETGWSEHLPSGAGLLKFSTVEEAAEAVCLVAADEAAHSRAARAVAEEHLDSDRVLGRILQATGESP